MQRELTPTRRMVRPAPTTVLGRGRGRLVLAGVVVALLARPKGGGVDGARAKPLAAVEASLRARMELRAAAKRLDVPRVTASLEAL